MNAVELESVVKRFDGQTAVDKLDLCVPKGSIYGFIGPNGSGKTTTMRMILRIIRQDEGCIRVFGTPTGRTADSRIGYLPEERGLYRKMKAKKILAYHAALKGVRLDSEAINRLLESVDLNDAANKAVESLSKGMAQKLQFLTAIAHRPNLLILDEPFSGLDPVSAQTLEKQIFNLRDRGTTIILSTHDMNVPERLCDTIFMIHKGRKVLDGSLSHIQAAHSVPQIFLKTDLPEHEIRALPMVKELKKRGSLWEIETSFGNHQELLAAIVKRAPVDHFQIATPCLRDIFLRIAGSESSLEQKQEMQS